jgi:hypothetical protein
VLSVANGVFMACSNLSSVTIGNGLSVISDEMFHNCANLTSVTIGTNVKSIGQKAFALCPELTDFYCYPQNAPSTGTDTFADSYIQYVTLHVPATSVSAYQEASPWMDFKEIVALSEMPLANKCATPTIAYKKGELIFSCATEGALCIGKITTDDVRTFSCPMVNDDAGAVYSGQTAIEGIHIGSSNPIKLTQTYTITVYATAQDYADSDIVTAIIRWRNGCPEMEGFSSVTLEEDELKCDVNNDGAVDVADISTIIDKMAGKARMRKGVDVNQLGACR